MNRDEARRRALATLGAAVAAVLVLAASFSLMLGSGTEAGAVSNFVQAFGAQYPDAAGSRIAVCLLCHTNPSPTDGNDDRNPYGDAVDEELRFRTVENLDSDGDGFTNIEEIRAHTFPGNSADNPNTVITTTTVPGATTTSTAPGSGGALYAANCQGCHGFGGGNLVPTTLSRSQLVSVIGGGRGSMPGFSGALTATQIGSIADALLGWSQTTTTQPGAATTTTAGGAVSGSGVYSQYCSGCHGAAPGNLAGRGLTAARVGSVTSTGTAGMPSFGSTLSGAQISAVASYVASLGGGATTTTTAGGPTTTAPPGNGAGLYAANCAGCHGPAGEGGVGGAIQRSGFGAAALGTLIRDGLGTMPGFGDRLSEGDVAALAEFTATLTSAGATTTLAPDDGSAGPVAHGGDDSGTGGAPWWKITLAVLLALAAAAGFGMLLVRSARQVFRS